MDGNEKYIVESLRNHHEEIDMDGLWADVAPQIPTEKKRRKMGFWIFGSLIIALMLAGIGWVKIAPNDMDQDKLAASQEFNIDQKSNLNDNSKNQLQNQEVIDKSTLKPGKIATTLASDEDVNNIDNQKISIQTKTDNHTIQPITDQLHIQPKKDNQALQENANTTESKIITDTKYPGILNSTYLNSRIGNSQAETEENYLDKSNIVKRTILNQTPQLDNYLSPLQSDEVPIFHDMQIVIPKIKHASLSSNRWSIYVLGGGALVNRDLSTKSKELRSELVRREAVVDVLGAWEVEAGIGLRLSPRLRLSTGLNYTQIHEKAVFESDYLVDYEAQTNNVIHREDGSVENKAGKSVGQGIRHTEEIRFNQLRMVQIPVRMTYNVLNIDNYKVNIGALASYTIQQQYDGFSSMSASQESYDLRLDEEDKFRSSGSVGFGLFLEGSTHLTKMLDLTFGIGYKQTKRINSEIYLIDQQYNSVFLTSGISRRF